MKAPWQIMTFADWLLVLSILVFALAGIARVVAEPDGSQVVVTSAGETCFVADLDQHQAVALDGPLGKTYLQLDEDGARVTASPCPRKLCVSMGSARQRGDLLACVPNQILVRIEDHRPDEAPYDLLSR